MSEDTQAVTFTLSEDAFLAACHQLWAHRAIGRWGNWLVAGLVALCGVALIALGVSGWAGWLGWAFIAMAIAFVALDLKRDTLWRRHYRRMVKYTAPITARFSDAGVGVSSAEGDNHVHWAQFRQYVVTQDYLFLLVDQRQFSVIPLAAFATPQHAAAAQEVVKAHLKPLARRMF